MAFAVKGFQTVAQNYISKKIASNFYAKAPFLALLGALTIGNNRKTSLEIGRPNSGEILSAKSLSPAERKNLRGINEYVVRMQGFKTNNTTARTGSGYGNAPTVANPTTNAHSQAGQFGAKFKWTHLDTPILIWQEDEIRSGQKETAEGQGLAMSQVVDEATEVGMQDLVDKLADQVWNGNPSNQNDDLWDAPGGMLQALDTANVYGQVDRADPACAVWKGQKDTTLKAVDINVIVDDANLEKQIGVKGNGVNCILTGTKLYSQFKTQILSQGGGGILLKDGLPEFAAMGVKKEVLQKDNAYIMYDPGCPANTVCALDLSVWKFIVNPMFNFTVTPFGELWKSGESGKWARQAYAQLRYMLTNDNPFLGVRYTQIGAA